jgi:hypothetical protein
MAHAEEIARLEQELAALRLQYANLERNGRVVKRFSALMLVVVAGLLGYLLWTDFVKGALFLVMAVAIGGLCLVRAPRFSMDRCGNADR